MSQETGWIWTRPRIFALSRAVIVALFVISLGGYYWTPVGPFEVALEILLRTHLMFLCTVMAHEGSHGHLGASREANDWWGRIALFPTMVPYVNFRKTHRMHHARTNIPGEDPDHFIKPNHWWEVPFRSVAIPHYWMKWLSQRGWFTRRDAIELALNYVVFIVVYSAIATEVGVMRIVASAGPALFLVSMLLWYPFAVRTHDGFSLGPAEERSHNYYGHFAYWFSLGLSMHRAHHMNPGLAWIQLLPYVERGPGGLFGWLPFRRDIRTSENGA